MYEGTSVRNKCGMRNELKSKVQCPRSQGLSRLWGQALIICYLKQPSAVSYQRSAIPMRNAICLWGQALIICYLKQPSAVSYQRSDTQWLRGSLWNAECGMWNVESSKFVFGVRL